MSHGPRRTVVNHDPGLTVRAPARARQEFVTPSLILELWMRKIAIEVGNEGGIDLAAVDRLRNRYDR